MLVDFDYQSDGICVNGKWYPILKMEWADGSRLDSYVEDLISKHATRKLGSLANEWKKLVESLRLNQVAHGDLQHENILISNNRIRLVDYDGAFVPSLAGRRALEVGHPNYQHPDRTRDDFDLNLDNFSALVIYLSLRALSVDPTLWHRFHKDKNLLLRSDDYRFPHRSQVIAALRQSAEPEVRHLAATLETACTGPMASVPDLTAIPPQFSSGIDWRSSWKGMFAPALRASKGSGISLLNFWMRALHYIRLTLIVIAVMILSIMGGAIVGVYLFERNQPMMTAVGTGVGGAVGIMTLVAFGEKATFSSLGRATVRSLVGLFLVALSASIGLITGTAATQLVVSPAIYGGIAGALILGGATLHCVLKEMSVHQIIAVFLKGMLLSIYSLALFGGALLLGIVLGSALLQTTKAEGAVSSLTSPLDSHIRDQSVLLVLTSILSTSIFTVVSVKHHSGRIVLRSAAVGMLAGALLMLFYDGTSTMWLVVGAVFGILAGGLVTNLAN